jgi:hypothetical protein
MAQGAIDLSDPLDRLDALPTAINWRGEWDPNTLFYRNDIAVSPITKGSYINVTPATTISGGGDPSLNAVAWYAFGSGAAGVQEITGTEYITVGPTTTPKITNNGVVTLEIAPGTNLNNLGTAQDPILEDTGVTNVLADPGILITPDISNSNLLYVDNTGVVNIVTDSASGFTTGSDVNNVSLFYTGILSVNNPPNSGITVGTGQSPLVTNTGLLSLNVGTGLSNISTPQTPNIINTGVIDISGSGVTVTGFPSIKLSTTHPSVSLIGTITGPMVPNPTLPTSPTIPNPPGRIPITQTPGTFWATSIATQTPYSSGTFFLNLNISMLLKGPSSGITFAARGKLSFTIYDSVNNVVYAPITPNLRESANVNTIQFPRTINSQYRPTSVNPIITSMVVDLQSLWTSGFRTMTHIQISHSINNGAEQGAFQLSQGANVFATYSPVVITNKKPR